MHLKVVYYIQLHLLWKQGFSFSRLGIPCYFLFWVYQLLAYNYVPVV